MTPRSAVLHQHVSLPHWVICKIITKTPMCFYSLSSRVLDFIRGLRLFICSALIEWRYLLQCAKEVKKCRYAVHVCMCSKSVFLVTVSFFILWQKVSLIVAFLWDNKASPGVCVLFSKYWYWEVFSDLFESYKLGIRGKRGSDQISDNNIKYI